MLLLIFPIVLTVCFVIVSLLQYSFLKGNFQFSVGPDASLVNVQWFQSVLPKTHRCMKFIGGELNPHAYHETAKFFEDAAKRGVIFTIVFGPSLAIDSEFAQAKDNEHIPLTDVHPIFKLADLYPQKFNLYIPVMGESRHEVHSGIADSYYACIEEPHKELDERGILVYEGNKVVVRDIERNIDTLITRGKVQKIHPNEFNRNNLKTVDEFHQDDKTQLDRIEDKLDILSRRLDNASK